MLCDGLKQWEQFIGLHSKHVEDDVDDHIVPREGRCEAEVGEKTKQPQVELTHGANYEAHMGPATELFMGYGAGCEETTWWAKALREIFGHPVCTCLLYKLSFTPCRSSEH
jgi:hypothetical protein